MVLICDGDCNNCFLAAHDCKDKQIQFDGVRHWIVPEAYPENDDTLEDPLRG